MSLFKLNNRPGGTGKLEREQTMKHQAPQYDLPGVQDAFNLSVQCAPAVASVQPVKSDLEDETESLFGPVIFSYTRAQAIEDGWLVDVSEAITPCPFKYPVAMTRAAYEATVAAGGKWNENSDGTADLQLPGGQDVQGRMWDVFQMLLQTMKNPGLDATQMRNTDNTRVYFHLLLDKHGNGRREIVQLYSICGPGDTAAPVITILMRGED
jgi:hypothetical protein